MSILPFIIIQSEMNNDKKDIEKDKPPNEVQKTGYKIIDATLYIFVFLYDANRKNLRAFVNTLLILSLICVCSLYIEENRGKQKAIENAVKEAELRGLKDMAYLKAQNDTLYHNLRDCNRSINDIYQSILLRTQQEKERLENSQYQNSNKKGNTK